MATIKIAIITLATLAALGWLPSHALAQTNPVPFINLPLVPGTVAPGTPDFILTVNGTGFAPLSVVYWNGSPRTTKYLNAGQLVAIILAQDVAYPTAATVGVVTPAPVQLTSNRVLLEVAFPRTTVNFSQASVAAPRGPYFVGVGDLNKDGKPDLVVTDPSAGVVSVFLGNGDGTFQPPTDYPVGRVPVSAAIADINGDGNSDVVVANQNSDSISVLLGNGDGALQAAVNYGANIGPKSIVLGDFNGDGNWDVAVANGSGSAASILLGNGDGTFQTAVGYGSGMSSTSIAIGDFNGDNRLDLAVAQSSPSGVNILLGNGDGTFQNPQLYTTDAGAQSVAVADFNGDGKLDLAVACQATAASDINILLGNGDGTFQTAVAYPTGQMPYSVAVGDLNGDGILDLATSNNSGRSASMLLGNGDGTFQAHQDHPFVSGFPLGLALADLNRDGLPDLAVASDTGYIAVMLQTTVALAPPSLSFGSQMVGTSKQALMVTLTNTSSVALRISGIAIGGSDTGDFSQDSPCVTTIAPAASCTITVIFTPQAMGTRTATVIITDDASHSPQIVPLSGVGIQPVVQLSPASLTFPLQLVTTTSPAQKLTLTNSGNQALAITGIAATGDFSQTNTCGTSVAPVTSCTISVTFQPLTKGPLTGTVSVTDNAPGSPQTVPLAGTGTTVRLQPTSLNLGSQPVGTPSPPRMIGLFNRGGQPLKLAITITGANAGDFAQTNTCGSKVASGTGCAITVTFTPTATGTRTADVTVIDNGGGGPQVVTLAGTGT